MMLSRAPGPFLAPFVKVLWASDEAAGSAGSCARELVLPTGTMHVALRLSDAPLRLFDDADDERAHDVSTAVVGGARASYYVRDVSRPVRTVGAQLQPGAAGLLLGVPADELAERHTPLASLWGDAVERMRAQLAEAPSLEQRLALFERLLWAKLPRLRGLHPAVAEGLFRLRRGEDVAQAAAATGYSHRRFTSLFRAAVGLAPKAFCRVQRFEQALAQVGAAPQPSWSALAVRAGYSDQAHFNREFREFAGITPGRYVALTPTFAHHVPLPAVRSESPVPG